MKVYLDHGATTKPDVSVIRMMSRCMEDCFGNPSSLHSYGTEAASALEESRAAVASLIGSKSSEIIFTSGGTESDNLAIKGACYANRASGNHIITTTIEHPAVLNMYRQLEREGFLVTYLGVDAEGFVDIGQLRSAITGNTVLVSVMHANNEIGTVQDIAGIGKICREMGVLFHTDAVQSLTKVPIDVAAQDIDLLSVSAHKIYGPKGVGALFVRDGVKIARLMEGGSQEGKLRAGTENMPAIMGFACACGLSHRIDNVRGLRDRLLEGIRKRIPNVLVNGPADMERRLCNNLSVSFQGVEGEALLMMLDMRGIAVSTGSACSSKSLQPSHVLMAIGLPPQIAHGTLRFSLGKDNTLEEIDYTVEQLAQVVAILREMSPYRGDE